MLTLTAAAARAKLFTLVDRVAVSHETILIIGKCNNAVLVSEEDWRALNETLYLVSIPGMQESIIEGLITPIEDCEDESELWNVRVSDNTEAI